MSNPVQDEKSPAPKPRSKRKEGDKVLIKKYANRRLYNTASSTYVTLDNLSEMVRDGVDFVVYDAKTSEDITRSVLAQIIFEEESRGQNLLPIQFLRQLIGFYGDSMQSLLPSYLEASLEGFSKSQERFRQQWQASLIPTQGMGFFEEQVKQNVAMFDNAMKMFTPFSMAQNLSTTPSAKSDSDKTAPAPSPSKDGEVASLRAELEAMKAQIDRLANKS